MNFLTTNFSIQKPSVQLEGHAVEKGHAGIEDMINNLCTPPDGMRDDAKSNFKEQCKSAMGAIHSMAEDMEREVDLHGVMNRCYLCTMAMDDLTADMLMKEYFPAINVQEGNVGDMMTEMCDTEFLEGSTCNELMADYVGVR